MGGSSHSDYTYHQNVQSRGPDPFAQARAAAAATGKVHKSVDVKAKNKAGLLIRESLDSDGSPNSKAVIVNLDVTGSMGALPPRFLKEIPKFMGALVKKGFLPSPQILSAANADSHGDAYPIQATQFETGNEIETGLMEFVLGGGGGGSGSEWTRESYALNMLFFARRCKMDCWDKRGEKGYCFFIGDEYPYETVTVHEAKTYLDIDLEHDMSFKDILAELREKFEVFWVYPTEANYFTSTDAPKFWKDTMGDHYIELERVEDICELMVGLIGTYEGYDLHTIAQGLTDLGSSKDAIANMSKSLSTVVRGGTSLRAKASSSIAASAAGSDAERLN